MASFTELIALRTAPGSQKPAIVPSRAQRTSRAQRKSIIPVLIVCLGSALLATLTFYALFDAPKLGPPIERPVALVTASWLNCREQPNPTTNVLETAKQGEKLILHDQVGDWRRVRLHDSPCWVNSRYLRPTGQKVFDRPMTAY